MKKILSYAGEDKKYLISAVGLLLLATVCGIVPFFFLNQIIITLVDGTFVFSSALTMLCYIAGALILKAVFFGAGLGLSHIGAFNTLFNMRNTFAKDMAHQPMGHILDEGTGKYKKTFVEDISILESCLAHAVPEGVPYIFGSLLTIIAIFMVDWRIGIVVLVMVPVSMLPMGFMMKVGMEKMPEYYRSRDELNHSLIEFVTGMEVIKIFNKADKSYENLEKTVNYARDFTLDWCAVTWKAMSVLNSLLPCTLLLPLPLATYLFLQESMSFSDLTLIIMLCLSLSEPLLKLVNFMPSIPQIGYAIEKVESVFKYPDVECGEFSGELENSDVEFKNITFAYGEKEVIHDVSFSIPQNSICALVGASGSGKSTLAKLLLHFWEVSGGEIIVGGKNIKEFTFGHLMDSISYVSQENTLFEGTIFENIVIAKEGLSREDVVESCKKAQCHDFISSLPQGYDTNVGTLGGKLSGGERQRITIARAMIKNAPIIVLDEATAFADAENEFLIQEALSSLLQGKTVIMIAHKLHTITEVDQIIVLDQGKIHHKGTHEELLQHSSVYQGLWAENQKSVHWNLGGVSQ